jgi:hypothetical protein
MEMLKIEQVNLERVLSFIEINSPDFPLFPAITNAGVDLSPVLLGILFTLVLLCSVIFAKLYCFRSTTSTNGSSLHNGDSKHIGNINYKLDATKVSGERRIL